MDNSPQSAARRRIEAIDILRGAVIVLMVLDHVRDFVHVSGSSLNPLDPDHTTPLLYLTRWVTHFCAPTFVFLAGLSAQLQLARGKSRSALAWLLLTRGFWLILLENTVIGFAWSFRFPFVFFLQVMWAIGWSMIVLAGLVWLPRLVVLTVGAAIIAGHDLLDGVVPTHPGAMADLSAFFDVGGYWSLGRVRILDVYPVLAWIGIMSFGYGLGQVFVLPPERRDRILRVLGLALIAMFFVLRCLNGYGDPHPWHVREVWYRTVMAFFDVEKYPPSLMFVCATLGPVLVLFPWIARWRGAPARALATFGSVPLFAYVLHIYIAHALAIALHILHRILAAGPLDIEHRAALAAGKLNDPGLPLFVTYLAWLGVLILLYPLCRWFADVKRRRNDWWLGYL